MMAATKGRLQLLPPPPPLLLLRLSSAERGRMLLELGRRRLLGQNKPRNEGAEGADGEAEDGDRGLDVRAVQPSHREGGELHDFQLCAGDL